MNLIRYNTARTSTLGPVFGRSPWQGLESEFDRLFETALGDLTLPAFEHRFAVDLYEDNDSIHVRAELPGLTREDINVELVDGYLTINGDRKTTAADGNAGGSFSLNRSISIPRDVQADKIAATYENGVLAVVLPKREEAKPKKITIDIK